ncbi:hypothetical protein XA68_18246 [Ophiocordyceps unilateralis]|uniref:Zn(2)-C6 fungal-type domain-containing protein n=1 Tax=Ophiocordyceps unilateralis TaxID=268505 RepID=A0A2A9PJK8_OPHUN|nr:hypothetical protein XA68_18246 [Ophiocordyceps unilateralis]
MVGVPGKYKGCETCRRRRCEGYERERVFITGTLETKGRVASHPKRAGSASKHRNKAAASAHGVRSSSKPQIVPTRPLTSAWDDSVTLSGHGVEASVRLTALQTSLQNVVDRRADDAAGISLSLPPFVAPELQAQADGGGELSAKARCLVRLGGVYDAHDLTDGYCAFLFEVITSAARLGCVQQAKQDAQQSQCHEAPNNCAEPWDSPSQQASLVKRLGPKSFTTFPNHQYFVRVYRPLAVSLALLGRRDSFLSEQDWMSTPWTGHPKSPLDRLFDVVLRLPSILATADDLLPLPATMTRRIRAQDLLQDCLIIEMHFHEWLQSVTTGAEGQHAPYWSQEESGGEIPFANPYAFRDGLTALMMLYYWMALIPFHRCIDSLHEAIFQPVVDAYPNMWPDLPPNLQIDPSQYQDGRELAANICRGLNAALDTTTQPEILVAPMTVAMEFYRNINATSQDGVLEILWLEAFQRRLAFKVQYIAGILQQQRWVEVARY